MINASASLLQIGSALSVSGVKRLFNCGSGWVVTPVTPIAVPSFDRWLSSYFFSFPSLRGKSDDKRERSASTAFFCLLR
ncbi:hypothetical protein [Paenibacillus polysaccharolyticus]|uniref:hypothetical protein n=1 Tax=Paenibacillus polysaccharolyticus TaxID=582692 RepID=UPI0011135083|nr:hypothetical protein [Paenibacillus polysaccharolyticus]